MQNIYVSGKVENETLAKVFKGQGFQLVENGNIVAIVPEFKVANMLDDFIDFLIDNPERNTPEDFFEYIMECYTASYSFDKDTNMLLVKEY